MVTGWGKTLKNGAFTDDVAERLQKAELVNLPSLKDTNFWTMGMIYSVFNSLLEAVEDGNYKLFQQGSYLAFYVDRLRGACGGDSGGPAVDNVMEYLFWAEFLVAREMRSFAKREAFTLLSRTIEIGSKQCFW